MKDNKLRIEDIKLRFKSKSFFTYKDLYDFYGEKEIGLKTGTFKWRIYRLKEKGVIKDIKRGVYKLGSLRIFIPLISSRAKKLYNYLLKTYPDVQIYLWETSWLHSFMIHQPFNSFIIIETDKDILEPAFYALKEKGNQIYINPKKDFIEKYISNENVIIIRSIIQGTPIIKIEKIKVPKIEKILVDIFFEKDLFINFQGQELINIFKRIFEEYTINLTTLLRYARKRGIKSEIKNFLLNIIKIETDFYRKQ
ncbi:MAG: hypothetical protein M1479_10050 [Actinobacteria bacterium]|nr:hypothetical protein [Actinomycetota bacterium]